MAVTRETLRLAEELRAAVDRIVDTQTRDLVQAWAIAWDEVSRDLHDSLLELASARDDGRITRGMMLRSQRLHAALAVVGDRLEGLAGAAGVRISGDLPLVVATTGEAQEQIIGSQLPPAAQAAIAGWDQVDPEAIAAIVERATEQITSLTLPLSDQAYQAVRRELIRGVAAGSNPRETARRMVKRAEGRFNGGLTRALVIARTEMLDAHRQAAQLAQEQDANADVLGAWAWNAKLDARTCPACWSMHGRRFDLTEPGPLGHQQCRCARLPKTKTWAELGFDDIEEPSDLLPNAREQFEALPPTVQQEILGPKRYQAWLAGEFPFEEWAARRENDGWRDSYVVASVAGGGGSGSVGNGGPPPTGGGSSPDQPGQPGRHSVGATLTIGPNSGSIRAEVDQAIALIDQVHVVDRVLPTIKADAITPRLQQILGAGVQGFYKHDAGFDPILQIKPVGDRVRLTIVHELGHMLDELLFGPGRSDQDMGTIVDPALFDDWLQAVRGTDAVQTLQTMLDWDTPMMGPYSVVETPDGRTGYLNPDSPDVWAHTEYLIRPTELFGRAYAQWIAAETNDLDLFEQLQLDVAKMPPGYRLVSGRLPVHPVHWTDADFAPVAAGMRRLFGTRNLLVGE